MIELTGLLSRTQAAKRAGMSGEWVDQARRLGKLHAIETPLGRLYDPAEIDAVMRRRAEAVPA